MSWSYSRVLVAEFSVLLLSGTGQSAPSTALEFSKNGKMMVCSRRSRYGKAISGTSTGRHGLDRWISCLAGSHVRTSAVLGAVPGLQGPARGCGRKWRGWWVRYDQSSSSWKTRQASLLGDSDVFSGIWPRSGMMRNGTCSARATLAPNTDVTASGFWPTPTAADNLMSPSMAKWPAHRRMWATPTARDATRGGSRILPKSRTLNDQVGGPTNPRWLRSAYGLADRVDQVRALGNGQVPAVHALAFHFLATRLGVAA